MDVFLYQVGKLVGFAILPGLFMASAYILVQHFSGSATAARLSVCAIAVSMFGLGVWVAKFSSVAQEQSLIRRCMVHGWTQEQCISFAQDLRRTNAEKQAFLDGLPPDPK